MTLVTIESTMNEQFETDVTESECNQELELHKEYSELLWVRMSSYIQKQLKE